MRRALWGGVVGVGVVLGGCASSSNGASGGAETRASASSARKYLEEGIASYYGPGLVGQRTASGETLNAKDFTAAHRTLAFGTCLRVVNMENGQAVEVRVNDRGPHKEGRVVDVSLAAARKLGLTEKGLARVRLYRCTDAKVG